ncbi:kinase-like protein [Choiromyces venosus 120613-1]|uniref:Kinase-like protein n=1 Tax=Choiromyces venosus 120613-1 TaxID=1336337 RepID=A0A3N4JHK9_9PEZI|nr:kinase-like protein [Choiromyces venosus 120613-1]
MPRVEVTPTITRKVPPQVHPLRRYPGAVKIYSRHNGARQIYDLGNGHLYKFRPHRDGVYESDIHTMIRSATRIPIPKIYYEWVTTEGTHRDGSGGVRVHHMIMEKVKGEPLYKVWKHLNLQDRGKLVHQFRNYLDQLRGITCLSVCSFDGGPLHDDHGFLFDSGYICQGPISDHQSLWLAMTSDLRRSSSPTIKKALLELRSIMPGCFPAVLTHTDLHQGNILVHDGNISAIIDWEDAGFFPRWMEYVKYYPVSNAPELEFQNLVVKGMEDRRLARQFMGVLDALRSSDPGKIEWAIRVLRH